MTRRSQYDAGWRDGGAVTGWPARWPTYSGHWPEPQHTWTLPHPGRALTACIATCSADLQVISWASLAEAVEAAHHLLAGPCRPACHRRHLLIWTDSDTVHTITIEQPPPQPSLAAELRALYPGSRHRLEAWAVPPTYNEPLS